MRPNIYRAVLAAAIKKTKKKKLCKVFSHTVRLKQEFIVKTYSFFIFVICACHVQSNVSL